ncbi:MAG: peptide-methionine (R)-S-oxide reductase, partial [Paracoccaceae bacterium]
MLFMRHEATDHPFANPLNKEYGQGIYHCAKCDLLVY